ncbi:filamentous hemagglutinin N-terminal domain-containing protein, partial [Burkholderia sp. DN3021]|uniref:two-partner secretion domain-containing protein n=1 Tax=Burkholderia sp. DN3021 TaxID=3410137 RepID=UPI003C7A977C
STLLPTKKFSGNYDTFDQAPWPNGQLEPLTAALLEVTQQRSALQGTLESFGGKLDVLVANQHGVTINGLTTLNVGRLGVTTGQVLPQADGTVRIGVTQGDEATSTSRVVDLCKNAALHYGILKFFVESNHA